VEMRVQAGPGRGEAVLPVAVHMEAGEHGTTRGTAGGLGNVSDVELHPPGGQPVHVGRFNDLVAIGTELKPKIVAGDEQHIEGCCPGTLPSRG